MTGFGRGQSGHQGRRFTVEVRSVNHRFLDMKVRLPWPDVGVEASISEVVRARLERGRVEVVAREHGATAMPDWIADPARARLVLEGLLSVKRELAIEEPVRLEHLLLLGEQLTAGAEHDSETRWRWLEPALVLALDALEQMRRTEGAALERDLRSRVGHVRELAGQLSARLPVALHDASRRLAERVQRLLGQVSGEAIPQLDPQRLAQEVALLADRTDVSEELTRIRSHLDQMEARCAAREAVGRQLDFLLQELSREVNTIGSKAQDTEVSRLVVELKGELEKLREQVQNVE